MMKLGSNIELRPSPRFDVNEFHFWSMQIFFSSTRRKEPSFGNEFRKPVWYDEESDDELFDNNKIFGFQVFTNPLEMQKYYEAQMQEMVKSMNEGVYSSQNAWIPIE